MKPKRMSDFKLDKVGCKASQNSSELILLLLLLLDERRHCNYRHPDGPAGCVDRNSDCNDARRRHRQIPRAGGRRPYSDDDWI